MERNWTKVVAAEMREGELLSRHEEQTTDWLEEEAEGDGRGKDDFPGHSFAQRCA